MENEKKFQPKESEQKLTPGQKLKIDFIDGQDRIAKLIRIRTLTKENLKSVIDQALENGLLREFKNREEKLKIEASDFINKLELGIKYKNLDPADFPGAIEMAINEFRAIKPTTTENYGIEEKIQAEKGRKLWGFVFKPDEKSEPGYFLKRTKKDKNETEGIRNIKWQIFNACQKVAETLQSSDYQKELEKNRKEGKIRRQYWEPSSIEIGDQFVALHPHYTLREKGLDDLRPARDFFRELKEAIKFLKTPEYRNLNQFLQEHGFSSLLELEKKDEEKEFKRENFLQALKKTDELKITQPVKAKREELDQLKEQRKLIEFLILGYNPVTKTSIKEWRHWQLLENPDPAQNSINWEIFKKIRWYRNRVIEKEKADREERREEKEIGEKIEGKMSKKEEREIWERYRRKEYERSLPANFTPGTIGEKMEEEGLTREKLLGEKKKRGRKAIGLEGKVKGWGEKGKRREKGKKIGDEGLEDEKAENLTEYSYPDYGVVIEASSPEEADKILKETLEKEIETSTPSIPKEEKKVTYGDLIEEKIKDKERGKKEKKKEDKRKKRK